MKNRRYFDHIDQLSLIGSSPLVMLRRRSRSVTGNKQSTLSDHTNNSNNDNVGFPPSPSDKPCKSTSNYLFKILNGFFFTKPTTMNPPSLLDTNLFRFEAKTRSRKACPPSNHPRDQPPVGLALINQEAGTGNLVVFGSQLKNQIPAPALEPTPELRPVSPKNAMEFGMKTRNSSFVAVFKCRNVQVEENYDSIDGIPVRDMELSEEYTCIISHGPNPKTTHIFGNYIVDSCTKPEKFCNEQNRNSAIERDEMALCSQE